MRDVELAKIKDYATEDSYISLQLIFFQAEDGIRDKLVTGVQTCALPICARQAAEQVGDGRHPADQDLVDEDAIHEPEQQRRQLADRLDDDGAVRLGDGK